MPGEPQHRPLQVHESVLTTPIADEAIGVDVPSPPVDLDHDLLQRKRQVDQEVLDSITQFPTGDPRATEEPNQQPFSMRCGPVGRDGKQPGGLG